MSRANKPGGEQTTALMTGREAPGKAPICARFRYVILITAALCLTSLLSNMNTYNFTKICMNPKNGSTTSELDAKSKPSHRSYRLEQVAPSTCLIRWFVSGQYNKLEQSWLQACVAIGALAASVPYTYMFQHYTKKWVFLSAGIISAISTILIPTANEYGFKYFLVARTFQGIAFSATFPVIGAITADWATLTEHGLFCGLLTGCTQLSQIFTMPVSGTLCTSRWGWPSVYYAHAFFTIISFCFWILLYKDTPEEHKFVGGAELKRLQTGKTKKKNTNEKFPYKQMLTDKTLLGAWIAAFGDLLAVQLVTMFNPQYVNDYLRYNVFKTGFLAALPVAVQFCLKLLGGVSSDMLTCLDETLKLRIYNSLALGASAFFFIILAFIRRESNVTAIVILVFAESLLGLNTAGFNKCITLHSRQFGHFGMTQIMNIWAVTILLEPFVVNAIISENTFEDWRNCFLIHAGILLLCNVIFCIWADAKPAPWTCVADEKADGEEMAARDGVNVAVRTPPSH
ncbi:transporter, major facilitator family protein [Necator americanus]|uniref:Transporter, major facilitator family protein n=1 Tax=Necator americanus TaxID=51031 RepID=W2TGS2_NECAM|nr:transporter, major facilitator family protein [Necator americanus]ETN80232.1 transporter, major facilitator family protein [Necator americanus]